MHHNSAPPAQPSRLASGLAADLTQEHDYYPRIEGKLPSSLQGTLYRNGPGRFERNKMRKNHLLDGDGMIQAFDFHGDRVRYRNRFVRTPKFLQEEQAGRFLFPTWSTRAPGGVLKNFGNRIISQAGVTAVLRNQTLYAFDEVGLPFGLDPSSLDTLGEKEVGTPQAKADYKAHTKTDPKTNAWLLLGVEHGRQTYLHFVEHAANGNLIRAQRHAVPRSSYFHDWFATDHYFVVSLQPLLISLPRFLLGLASYIDSMRWQPSMGNLLVIVHRNGKQAPLMVEAPPCFMWHSLNAYETGQTIVADFVGYQAPDHFIGHKAAFRTIMQGQQGLQNHPGLLRRYTIDIQKKRVNEEIIQAGNFEFPMLNPRLALQPHRYGYFSTAAQPGVFHNGLARIDVETGARQEFYMNSTTQLGEPIFVPTPNTENEEGWLLSIGLDGETGTSFLGIFPAHRIGDGPVARVLLNHATPLSFHGWWHET